MTDEAESRDGMASVPWPGGAIQTTWPRAILILGAALFGLLLIETALIWAVRPQLAFQILGGLSAELIAGREGGIPVYLEAGVPPPLTMQYSFTQDLMAAFLVYPIFLHLLNRYHDRDNFVMRRIRNIEQTAERNKRRVDRYGPVFLFFFMLVPFLVNGPLVGLMIGRLARIRMSTLLRIVATATLLAAAAWTLFFDTLFAWAERVMPAGPTYITIGMIGLVALLLLVGFVREKIQDRRGQRQGRAAGVSGPGEPEEKGRDY